MPFSRLIANTPGIASLNLSQRRVDELKGHLRPQFLAIPSSAISSAPDRGPSIVTEVEIQASDASAAIVVAAKIAMPTVTVGQIVRTAMSLSTADPDDLDAHSVLLERVIDPAVRKAGETFLADLDSITVDQMCETAETLHVLEDEKVGGDFAI